MLLNCYGGISISISFSVASFFFPPLSFTCVSIIVHKKSDDLAFRVWQIATHSQPTIVHIQNVLYCWVNGILNGRPIGVFLTLKNIFESSSFRYWCWCSCYCCCCSCSRFLLVLWFMRQRYNFSLNSVVIKCSGNNWTFFILGWYWWVRACSLCVRK